VKTYLVTVKLAKNPDHDPHRKVIGPCPLNGDEAKICTDTTGEHHTIMVQAMGYEAARINTLKAYPEAKHVTRIEEM